MKKDTLKHIIIIGTGILFLSLAISMLVPLILPSGSYNSSMFSSLVVLFLTMLILALVWKNAGGGKKLFWIMLAAFLVRLILGAFLAWALPRFGYAEPSQLAGYFYFDAFMRDGQAWQLAESGTSVLKAFGGEFVTDQYGGLLALSAQVYRVFSPDAHRPFIMVVLSAGVSALGLPFIISATRKLIDKKAASLVGWTMALFPEMLILGATQMREPFLVTSFAICFWAVSPWFDRDKRILRILSFFVGVTGMLLVSTRMALPLLAILFIWSWIEFSSRFSKKWIKIAGWVMLLLFASGLVALSWSWLKDVMKWDILLAYRGSGWIEKIFDTTPDWFHAPFIIVYGLFQPVLPAAIVDPAPLIWRLVGIVRGLGWYGLIPFLIYGLFTIWKIEDKKKRQLFIWLALAIWGWILLSSARAGGDQWDNPRYRMILLPWMCMLTAWGITWVIANKSRWLWRWLMVEGIFLLFFTHWYISRYTGIFKIIPFGLMVILIVGLSGVVMVGGWLLDRKRTKVTILKESNEK